MGDRTLIGVLGATSHVGQALLPLLINDGFDVIAFSRQSGFETPGSVDSADRHPLEFFKGRVNWRPSTSITDICDRHVIPYWISLAPIKLLPEYFDAFQACRAKRIAALASTSRFTKCDSSDPDDQSLVQNFIESELKLQTWAENNGIEFVILRPTLIYGLGKDKNICEIIRLVRRFGFFPLLGQASGLRQPVHCQDVAAACLSALRTQAASNKCYNLSGAEILAYKDMVGRIFEALALKPRFFNVPMVSLRAAVWLLRLIPRYRQWSFAMVERMNKDMIFDHQDAERDLDFRPRPFRLNAEDLP